MHYVVSHSIDGENILHLIADYYYYCFAPRNKNVCASRADVGEQCTMHKISALFLHSFPATKWRNPVQTRTIDRWNNLFIFYLFLYLFFGVVEIYNQSKENRIKHLRWKYWQRLCSIHDFCCCWRRKKCCKMQKYREINALVSRSTKLTDNNRISVQAANRWIY